jgi:hypothetical protein
VLAIAPCFTALFVKISSIPMFLAINISSCDMMNGLGKSYEKRNHLGRIKDLAPLTLQVALNEVLPNS